ncbi:thiamine phosphate synthase [Lachnospira pectinoschiza]|uniref:Thiamine-phosphate synthase n=1 Tax=Lachnospira pectinoschiza TaxID=28052 RepID=A0A1G9TW81_9FIRM|nr:thiamine phosphate synthase [Lachnospira pectinoschiza]SDM52030.1 thiamine-phosphate diphosphorylase [Lachnospira pectinoschiza]
MKCDKENMLLYAVTDRAWTGKQSLYEQVEEALKGGITCLQLREKNLSDEEFLKEAIQIKALCNKYKVPFFINDNVEVAIKSGADGIHVGQDDMAAGRVRELVGDKMMIGVSAHSVKEAVEAVKNGADCLGVGAIFSTSTKKDASVLDLKVVADICKAVDVPVVAIGGIKKDNISKLKGTGVDGVALVSAIFAADDIKAECEELRKLSADMIK